MNDQQDKNVNVHLLLTCGAILGFPLGLLTTSALSGMGQNEATILGSFMGAFIGLIAVVCGSYYNSELNRKRDKKLLEFERTSIGYAISSELTLINERANTLLNSGIANVFLLGRGYGPTSFSATTYKSVASKIGLLDKYVSGELVKIYEHVIAADIIITGHLQRNDNTTGHVEIMEEICKYITKKSPDLIRKLQI